MSATAVTLAVVLGLTFGSFLTVVAARVPSGLSIVAPGSRCPRCASAIRTVDNIPVISYVLRRGHCRACSAPIAIRYPATELATAALFGMITARLPTLWSAPAYCALAAGLVALTLIDLEHRRLPTSVIVTTGLVGLPLLVLASVATHDTAALVRVMVAGAVAFTVFLLIFVAAPGGMGFGDVRLAGLCGAFLGWIGYRVVAVGFLVGFVSAGLVAVVLLATGRAKRKTALPFGPFLAFGTFIGVVLGPVLAHAWLH